MKTEFVKSTCCHVGAGEVSGVGAAVFVAAAEGLAVRCADAAAVLEPSAEAEAADCVSPSAGLAPGRIVGIVHRRSTSAAHVPATVAIIAPRFVFSVF